MQQLIIIAECCLLFSGIEITNCYLVSNGIILVIHANIGFCILLQSAGS